MTAPVQDTDDELPMFEPAISPKKPRQDILSWVWPPLLIPGAALGWFFSRVPIVIICVLAAVMGFLGNRFLSTPDWLMWLTLACATVSIACCFIRLVFFDDDEDDHMD